MTWKTRPETHVRRTTALATILLATLAACGPAPEPTPDAGETPDAGTTPDAGIDPVPQTASIESLTVTSADDYAHNRFGLIEGATLATYAANWKTTDTAAANAVPNGRPNHLPENARLVVLQLNAAERAPGENYVPSDAEKDVYTFELDGFRFNETRDTGLISNSVRYQASGPTTDAWLARYGIDLRRDFVVFASGKNTAANGAFIQELSRGVYWLTYWGARVDHLAIVNGSLEKNYGGPLVAAKLPEGAISNDGFSVKDLRTDATALTIGLEDFLAIVDGNLTASNVTAGFEKQFIIDARPTNQFDRTAPGAAFGDTHPGQFITTAWNSTGAPSKDEAGRAKNYVPVEGHVKGAATFPWANLVADAGDGNWKYKSKAAITALFEAAGYAPADKADKVVVSQCRTNFEVQVNGFAARVILGYPTVHFDGSLVEYLSLVSNHPDASLNLKPEDPAYKYRTDVPTRVQHFAAGENAEAPTTTRSDAGVPAYNVANGTGAADRKVAQAVVNKAATTTRKAIEEDRAYKVLVTE